MEVRLVAWGVVLAVFLVVPAACAGPSGKALTEQDIRISLELAKQDKDGFPQAFRVAFENASGRRGYLSLAGPLPGRPEGPELFEAGFIGFQFKDEAGRESETFMYTDIRGRKRRAHEQLTLGPGERVQRTYKISDLYQWNPDGVVEGGRLSDHLRSGTRELQVIAGLMYVEAQEGEEKPVPKLVASKPVVMLCSFDDRVFPREKPEGLTTPLHQAVRKGDVQAVQRLLVQGADVNALDGYKCTPLHLVDDPKIAGMLLAKGARLDVSPDYIGTPLHSAARTGSVEVMKLLIAKGAEVDALCQPGEGTPLDYAAEQGQVAAVALLLESGADPNGKWKLGNPLLSAACGGHDDVVALLLDKGGGVNVRGFNGWTALHGAAADGHRNAVELLLSRGADVSIKDNGGMTALNWAVWNAREKVAEVLLAHGADPNIKDDQGRTPLAYARQKGYEDVAKLLKLHGAKE